MFSANHARMSKGYKYVHTLANQEINSLTDTGIHQLASANLNLTLISLCTLPLIQLGTTLLMKDVGC